MPAKLGWLTRRSLARNASKRRTRRLVSRRRRPLRAAILYEVKHPNIVRVLEAQYDPDIDNAITFVTVYCEGKSIADALDEGYRFSIHQGLALTTQVLSALAHVRQR
jgi:serine/threonine protein kinase